MIYFSYLHHLTLTHTLVASTAAVHENLSGGLQTLKCTICMIIGGTYTLSLYETCDPLLYETCDNQKVIFMYFYVQYRIPSPESWVLLSNVNTISLCIRKTTCKGLVMGIFMHLFVDNQLKDHIKNKMILFSEMYIQTFCAPTQNSCAALMTHIGDFVNFYLGTCSFSHDDLLQYLFETDLKFKCHKISLVYNLLQHCAKVCKYDSPDLG